MPRSLSRLGLLALLLLPAAAGAQSIRLADSTVLAVSAPPPSAVGAFPPWWRDSVVAVWSRAFTGTQHAPAAPIVPGMRATVALQLLRDGGLRRARIVTSTGDVRLDSALMATSWEVGRTRSFPKFPVGVEGAGTDVELVVAHPLSLPDGGRISRAPRGQLPPRALVESDIPPLAPPCDSILAPPTGVEQLTLRALLESVSGDEERGRWAARVLTAIQQEYRDPGTLLPPTPPRVFFEAGSHTLRRGFPGVLRLVVDSTGHLTTAEMVTSTGYPRLDSALTAMARVTDSAGAIPPPPPGAAATTIAVRFEADRGETHRGVPLGIARFAIWELRNTPRLTRMGAVRYPEQARSAGIGGRITVEFVIGVDGRPIPKTVQVINSPRSDLGAAATATILGAEFQPATVRGCAVPMLVQQSINFNP